MLQDLQAAGISCTLILDSAIGYVMEQVDFVMVGAEGVVESGGIINKVCLIQIYFIKLKTATDFFFKLVSKFSFT